MQRRTILLFILFLVLAAFYATVTREGAPPIIIEQQHQTEALNRLDEQVLGTAVEAEDAGQE